MDKEKKSIKVQIRITPKEKLLIKRIIEANKELSISKLFLNGLYESCKKYGISDSAASV